jgi:membrane protein implicated in regulation of membrane protease activity
MMEIISQSQFWLIVGFIMLVIEMFSLSFFAFFIAMGALLTALLTYLGLLPTTTLQVIVFCVSSVLFLLLLRKLLKKRFSQAKGGLDYTEFVGDRVNVIKDIPENGRGKVFYRGTEWDAVSIDGKPIEKDTPVTILKMDGIIVIVRRS